MTVKEVQAQAAQIKQSVISSTTCTSDTVSQLRSLLFSEKSNHATSSADPVAAKTHTRQPTRGGRARAGKQPDIAILEAPGKTKSQLSDHDREKFATEIINTILKAFSEAVKLQSLATTQTMAKTARHKTSPGPATCSPQVAESPLQPLCANTVLIGKEQQKGSRRSRGSDSIEGASGLCAQAECARLAFSVLNTLKTHREPAKAPSSLQRELAMSTLINKLMALGLFEPAVRELRDLKRSLLVTLGAAGKVESMALGKANHKPRTTDLLVFPSTNLKGPLLAMVVTFQLQVMRLIAAKRDTLLSTASIEHLATKVPYSPANLIQAQLDCTVPSTRSQVANQLETLSQLTASISLSISCLAKDSDISRSMSLLAALRLQMLSLELRSQWWTAAGHRGNAVRDLVSPFNRLLGAFRRQRTTSLIDGYHVAKDTLSSLESFIRPVEPCQSSSPACHEAWRSVCCEMIEAARACSLDSEEKRWFEEYVKLPVDDSMSPCRKCTETCKRATMFAQYHRGLYNEEGTAEALETAVRHIEGNLHGSSEELDALLLGVIKLRKAAGIIIDKSQAPLKNNETPPSSDLIRRCLSVCSSSVLFLNRYIGTKPAQSAEQKVVHRYQQRLEQASTVAKTFIDSVVSIARISKGDDPNIWAPTDTGLQGCLRLAATIHGNGQEVAKDTAQNNTASSTFASISNAYWLRYVYLKQSSDDAKEARIALKASINAVESRPLRERSAAQLQTRLEHYASAMETAREYRKASENNKKALRMHVEMGDLDEAAAAAGRQSLRTLFARDSEFASLGRILVACARVAIKMESDVPMDESFFDDEQLEPASRGIALEQQLASLESQAGSRTLESRVILTVQAIATRLLALYEQHSFPIRRLRVTGTLLWLQSRFPGVLSSSLQDLITEDRNPVLLDGIQGPDSDLQLIAPHLRASRDAASAIQDKCPMLMQQKLESALGTWYYLLRQRPESRGLEAVIGDTGVWLLHLELLALYLDAYGQQLLRLSTLELLCDVREGTFPLNCVALVLNLTQSGLQCLQLGHVSKAGVAFHKAYRYINEAEVTKKAGVLYYIGYAEYSLATGSVSKCEEYLAVARQVFEECELCDQTSSTDSRHKTLQVVVDVASLYTQLAARRGQPTKALLFARQSLRIAHQTWTRISRRPKSSKLQNTDLERKDQTTALLSTIAEATVSVNDRSETSVPIRSKAPELWSLVPRLHRAYLQVASLYSNEGISTEAKCYLELSRKFAEAVTASGLLGQSLIQLADIMTRSEDYLGADSSFELAGKLYSSLDKDQHTIMYQLHLSKYHLAKGQFSAAAQTCALAESILQRFTTARSTKEIIVSGPNVDILQEQLSRFTLNEDTAELPAKEKRILVKQPGSKVPRAGKGIKTVDTSSCDASASSSLAFSGFRSDVLHQQVMLALRRDKVEQVKELLADAATQYCTPQETVFHAIVAAEISIRRGLGTMTGDPIFCVLPESTVSLPSILPIGPFLPSNPPKTKPVNIGKGYGKRGMVSAGASEMQSCLHDGSNNLCHLFREVQVGTSKVYELARNHSTTACLHRLSKLMAETLVWLSALGLSSFTESLRPSPSMHLAIIDAPKSISALRGQRAIQVEKMMLKEYNALCWPTDKTESIMARIPSDGAPHITSFQEQYLDIIPQSWQVLTLSLSGSRGEIVVSRLRSGQGPFTLSMPLDRHSSRDPDEESFGFSQAKSELQEIVALADQSTHSTQNTSRKGAQSAWWKGRTALDTRLKDLLANIEHMWFGGFHGVFSPQVPNRNLLSSFQVSLNAILRNHLPSRQGQGKKHESKLISLDPRVIELFVALGEPSELSDMDDHLMDLLYFVIDILQFCGERNAYDEVDFDSMTIATYDALRQYHEAVKNVAEPPSVQHTILILDKELHCFPWESLPCLKNQAITRMPSLSCLRDRILQQHRQLAHIKNGAYDGEKRFCVDRRNGAYVLNPSGDLKATQETFEEPLSNLGEWKGLTGTEPSEEQMKGYLQEGDIFLFFGHGSGSQYIRSRTIQRLDRCAVALLMGCSSGKLTAAGEFEPYGTPIDYLQAGCPAMLATLWNVTDKDIDRFSKSVLQKWGLLSSQPAPDSSPVKKTARSRGNNKARQSPPPSPESGNVSLDQAVAQGRESCIFPYLNGAAPVVYGIPVFVE
ncbi:MAG: hypothetical protein Q9172_003172 [Xanthocarpia lactea]